MRELLSKQELCLDGWPHQYWRGKCENCGEPAPTSPLSWVEKLAMTQDALDILQELVQLFSTKELPAICARQFINAFEKPSDSWSLGNQIIMWLHRTQDARGYRQWQEVGRYVRKGTHGFDILGPVYIWKREKEQDKETGEYTEIERKVLVGFKTIRVHPVENTDGKALPEYKPKSPPPLLNVATAWKIHVNYENTRKDGAYGYFDPTNNKIALGTEDVSTFFHELGHAGHSKIEKLKGGQDVEQEAIAELTACTLAKVYGYNVEGQAWNYIARYAGERSPQAVGQLCFRILHKVQAIIQLILKEAEKQTIAPIPVPT